MPRIGQPMRHAAEAPPLFTAETEIPVARAVKVSGVKSQ